jgi:uncharacterized protein YegP (UPF0339 family)
MLRYTSVAVVCLATAAVGFAQRQPSGSGSSTSGTSGSASGSAGSNGSATERKSGTSSDRATTAAGRSGQGHQAKATFEVYQDKSGEYRWRLRATNSQILAMAAQGYSDKRACMNAIESVRRDVADAPVEEKEATAGAGEDNASKSGTAASRTGSASKNGSATGSGTGTGSAAGSGSGDATTAGSPGRKTQPK